MVMTFFRRGDGDSGLDLRQSVGDMLHSALAREAIRGARDGAGAVGQFQCSGGEAFEIHTRMMARPLRYPQADSSLSVGPPLRMMQMAGIERGIGSG